MCGYQSVSEDALVLSHPHSAGNQFVSVKEAISNLRIS